MCTATIDPPVANFGGGMPHIGHEVDGRDVRHHSYQAALHPLRGCPIPFGGVPLHQVRNGGLELRVLQLHGDADRHQELAKVVCCDVGPRLLPIDEADAGSSGGLHVDENVREVAVKMAEDSCPCLGG